MSVRMGRMVVVWIIFIVLIYWYVIYMYFFIVLIYLLMFLQIYIGKKSEVIEVYKLYKGRL